MAAPDNAKTEATKREDELTDRVDELTSALGEAYTELRVWPKGDLPAFGELDAIRRTRWGVPGRHPGQVQVSRQGPVILWPAG